MARSSTSTAPVLRLRCTTPPRSNWKKPGTFRTTLPTRESPFCRKWHPCDCYTQKTKNQPKEGNVETSLSKASSNSHSKITARQRKAAGSMGKVGEALKVGAVAQRLGVSASMVRSWEKLGLASPTRSQSKYRLYTNDDLRVLRRAIYLRRVQGLNAPAILNQLKQEGLLNHRDAGPAEEQSSIGPRFRKLRLQRGEALATVANAVGVSIGFLSNLERSQSGASIGIMRKLAQYYVLNILDLFTPIVC